MDSELINKRNENIERTRVMQFYNLIKTNNYGYSDLGKVDNATKLIASGSNVPIDKLNSLINLEGTIAKSEELNIDFRKNMKVNLETLVSLIKNDPEKKDEMVLNDIFSKISEIKTELGIVHDLEGLDRALASRDKTEARLQELISSSSMNNPRELEEFERLQFTLYGANQDTIKNEQNLQMMNNQRFKENIADPNFIYEIEQVFKYITTQTNLMAKSEATKEKLKIVYGNIGKTLAQIKALEIAKKRHQEIITELGLMKINGANKDISVADSELVQPLNPEPVPEPVQPLESELVDTNVDAGIAIEKEEDNNHIVNEISDNINSVGKTFYYNGDTSDPILGIANAEGLEFNKPYKILSVQNIDGYKYAEVEDMEGLKINGLKYLGWFNEKENKSTYSFEVVDNTPSNNIDEIKQMDVSNTYEANPTRRTRTEVKRKNEDATKIFSKYAKKIGKNYFKLGISAFCLVGAFGATLPITTVTFATAAVLVWTIKFSPRAFLKDTLEAINNIKAKIDNQDDLTSDEVKEMQEVLELGKSEIANKTGEEMTDEKYENVETVGIKM